MLTTEAEARTKWCPHVRAVAVDGDGAPVAGAANKLQWPKGRAAEMPAPVLPAASRCIASGCMSWRWIGYAGGRGYCGLAGPAE